MRLRFSRAEVLPALAIGVPLVAEALFFGPADWTRLVRVLLAAATALALLWRIRMPLVTLAVVLAAPIARGGFGGGGGDGLHYLAVLVAVYSVGAHGRRRDGVIAAVLLLALLSPFELARVADGEWGERGRTRAVDADRLRSGPVRADPHPAGPRRRAAGHPGRT